MTLPPDSKLTRAKQRWAQDGRLPGGDRHADARLPPGQHVVSDWPVLDLGEQPQIAAGDWQLEIAGLVSAPQRLDWTALQALPQATLIRDIHCVTSWSRYDNRFTGVPVRALLDLVGPLPEAHAVMLYGSDGYTANLLLEDFAAEDALLTHSFEDAPLSTEHGGPVRLILPHLYLWKSAKWLRGIDFLGADEPGFWEERGYHRRGDPWAEQRYGNWSGDPATGD